MDQLDRDVITIGHGYGALVGSSACEGMIRVSPENHSNTHAVPRVASVQGIVSIAGWILLRSQSMLLKGPQEVFDFRFGKVRS
jgi:hypothetical protein